MSDREPDEAHIHGLLLSLRAQTIEVARAFSDSVADRIDEASSWDRHAGPPPAPTSIVVSVLVQLLNLTSGLVGRPPGDDDGTMD